GKKLPATIYARPTAHAGGCSNRDELARSFVEHRKAPRSNIEMRTVQVQPALTFQRLDTRKATQVTKRNLDSGPLQIRAHFWDAPPRVSRHHIRSGFVENGHPIGDEFRLRLASSRLLQTGPDAAAARVPQHHNVLHSQIKGCKFQG